jgi:hypothetical protein
MQHCLALCCAALSLLLCGAHAYSCTAASPYTNCLWIQMLPPKSVSLQWKSQIVGVDTLVDVQVTAISASWLGMAVGTVMLGNYTLMGTDTNLDPTYPAVGLYLMKVNTTDLTDLVASGPTLAPNGFTNTAFASHTSSPYPPFQTFSGFSPLAYQSPSASYTELKFTFTKSKGTLFNLVPSSSPTTPFAVAIGSPSVSLTSGTKHSNTASVLSSFLPPTSSPTASPTKKPTLKPSGKPSALGALAARRPVVLC